MFQSNLAQAMRSIGKLEQTLERLAYVPRRTAEIAAPKLSELLQKEFRAGQDPYGRAWAPLRPATLAMGRRPPPLTDSRQLRDGTMAYVIRASYAGIRLAPGAPYGYFHQVGFRNGRRQVPARRIFPQRGIPAAWKAALDVSAKRAAKDARSGR